MYIKRLEKEDWLAWKLIRLEMLRAYPQFFRSVFAEKVRQQDAYFQQEVMDYHIYAMVDSSTLMATFAVEGLLPQQTEQDVWLWGIYVKPAFQGQHLASRLWAHVLTVIQQESPCASIYLHCASKNTGAYHLYKKWGFVVEGIEKRELGGEDVRSDYVMRLVIY